MGNRTRRSLGALLMAVGLLMILSVAGYFAWTEVQASQIQSELEQGASAAAERATRVAQTLAQATVGPTTGATPSVSSAQAAAEAKAALTATRRPILPATATVASQGAATRRPTAARASATAARVAAAQPTPAPTQPPPPTPAPVKPVRLVIPDLKIDTKVVEMGWKVTQTKNGPVSEWVIPKDVAGHHLNSAGIGEPENLVISGHNNILGRVFMPISRAWNNDKRVKVDNFTDKSAVLNGRELVLYDAAGKQYNYVITDFYRLKDTGVSQKQRELNGRYIMPTGDERVTIVTCWPPTNNTHRLIVIARPEQ